MEPPYNICLYPGTGTFDGKSGDHILLAPAYNVTEADIKLIVDITARVIKDFFEDYFTTEATYCDRNHSFWESG